MKNKLLYSLGEYVTAMERVTLRVPEEQLERIECLIENGEYPNRSEFLRSGLRSELSKYEFEDIPFERVED